MAQELSVTAKLISEQPAKNLQLILQIDGFPEIFGAVDVLKVAKYGDAILYGDAGLVYGGNSADPNSRPWINVDGTTKRISQILEPDKESASSISKVNITLNDQNQKLSEIFSPGFRVPDILSREANFYVGFKEGAHPEDSLKIFNGTIDSISFGAGNANITLAHPAQLLRQTLFTVFDTQLDGGIDASVTTITLDSTAGLIIPADNAKSYVQIDDEIIEFIGTSGSDITGCIRGSQNTIAATHGNNTEVQSRYSLTDGAIDMALKLMLSTTGVFQTEDVKSLVFIDAITSLTNAIAFTDSDIENTLGLVVGDLLTVAGATNAGNNGAATITGFGTFSGGSYLLTDKTFIFESLTSATCDFTSKYDVYPEGAGMNPKQVDVQGFENTQSIFSTDFFDYDYFLKEEIELKEFLDKQVAYPSGLFIVPRKAKVGATYIAPGVAELETKTLDASNVLKPDNIKIARSTNKNFYNTIIWKYDEDSIEDKFKRGNVTTNETSLNRIKTGTKGLTIEAGGIRQTALNQTKIERVSRRLLSRYKFGAESMSIEVDFKTGFNIDVGDVVEMDGTGLNLTDTGTGNRQFRPKLYLVTNRAYGITDGKFKLDLIDSIFSNDGRVGVVAPASKVATGATTSAVPLKISFGTLTVENVKWQRYIGERIKFRSPDFVTEHIGTIAGFDPINQNTMLMQSPLAGVPAEDWIAEPPDYDNSDLQLDAKYKSINVFWNPQVAVVSPFTTTTFDVGAGDVAKFVVGAFYEIHSPDYSDTIEGTVTDITGTTITGSADFGFTPDATYKIDLIGFADSEKPYRTF